MQGRLRFRDPQSKAHIGHLRAMFSAETGSLGSFCFNRSRGNVKKPAPTTVRSRPDCLFGATGTLVPNENRL
jgi:hypothetical protein